MMNDRQSRASRKVAVLGPIPRDQIVTHAGERFEKYGCVLYTAVALSAGRADAESARTQSRRMGRYPASRTSGSGSCSRRGVPHCSMSGS